MNGKRRAADSPPSSALEAFHPLPFSQLIYVNYFTIKQAREMIPGQPPRMHGHLTARVLAFTV